MGINPIELLGEWDEGYALDKHTVKSIPIGEDAYGHTIFETTRSELGELLYSFKYCFRIDCIDRIIDLAIPFLKKWKAIKSVDIVMPVPSSNKNRPYQPACEIAREIAKYLKISLVEDVLVKTSGGQSKDMVSEKKKAIQGTIKATRRGIREFNVLLVDDIYDSGTTLSECVRALREDPNLRMVYVLTITKTKG